MIFLTGAELRELTQKERHSAQARELDYMSIPYRRRSNGTLAVLRIHVETPEPADARLPPPRPVVQP